METITVREWLENINMVNDSDRGACLGVLASVIGVNKITSYSTRITVESGERAATAFFRLYDL